MWVHLQLNTKQQNEIPLRSKNVTAVYVNFFGNIQRDKILFYTLSWEKKTVTYNRVIVAKSNEW